MIRPEALNAIWRWREALAAAVVILCGLWLIRLGGFLLLPLGAVLAFLGAGLAILAYRRLRFGQEVDAPGMVDVDERQISYFGPSDGGFVSLNDLAELRLLTLRGRRYWRLKSLDAQLLLVPIAASGAERLFDAFAALPGMDSQALVAALDAPSGPGGTGAAGRGAGR